MIEGGGAIGYLTTKLGGGGAIIGKDPFMLLQIQNTCHLLNQYVKIQRVRLGCKLYAPTKLEGGTNEKGPRWDPGLDLDL